MSTSEQNATPPSLNAADAFEKFVWLQGPYDEVAAANDFAVLSGFEQWERVRHYVEQIGYLVGKKNIAALDAVTNQSKSKLLEWLEEGRLRNRSAPALNSTPSHHLLRSKLLR